MKKTISLITIISFFITVHAQKNEFTVKADPNAGVFSFETEVLDYGTIAHKSDGTRVFNFTNIGKSPIIITRAKASCGCTVPNVPKKPIMPGESAKISVKYATTRVGSFSKSITIYSNAATKSKMIRIKGKVLPAKPKPSLEKPKNLMSAK